MASDLDIFTDLQNRLVTGDFSHGQKLQPEKIRRDYACSASTIREVLFRLSTAGLVEFQDQRGFRVPQTSAAEQHDLTKMRMLLECEGAVLSIRNGGVAWEARLAAAHHRLSHIEARVRSSSDPTPLLDLWSQAERGFHHTLIDACRSETLKRIHSDIYLRFRQQMFRSDRQFVYVPENIAQHQAILDAALDRDEAQVRVRITDHLSRNLRPFNA